MAAESGRFCSVAASTAFDRNINDHRQCIVDLRQESTMQSTAVSTTTSIAASAAA